MIKLGLASSLLVAVLFTGLSWCSSASGVQAPSALGRWEIQFSLDDGAPHKVRFDADASGRGPFLLLDVRSNLLPDATPTEAKWSQSDSNQMTVSGFIEFPIGNVGRDPGRLNLSGTFSSSDMFSGSVVFVSDLKDRADRSGSFTATRANSKLGVHLLSFNSGGKIRRGREVTIEWETSGVESVASVDLLLSVDNGESFLPIASNLAADRKNFVWAVPGDMSPVKRALFKIIVSSDKGSSAEDTSDSSFKIK